MTPLPQEPSVERRRPVGVGNEDEVDRVEVWKVVELLARPDKDDAGGLLDDREAVEIELRDDAVEVEVEESESVEMWRGSGGGIGEYCDGQ